MRAHHRRCAPGRDPAALYELLDALRAGGARATFFVTAGYAECLPDERSRWATGRPAQWPRMAPRVKAEWRAAVRTALHQLVREGHEFATTCPPTGRTRGSAR
mmetsp:Transcript_34328/g.85554  ORF Transcript_34328/g.85554 Transcript_34328/m.85554 type:complete len:103 (-) Transcript_34328:592-900(-)